LSEAPFVTDVPDYRSMWMLPGRVFIVLGAAEGIGRQAAHAVAQAGAHVVCVGRRADATAAVAAEVGGSAIVADATVRADVERIASATMGTHGRIDGLVDIIGMPLAKPLVDCTDADIEGQFNVNLRHVFLSMQVIAPIIGKSGGGSLVYVSSLSGKVVSTKLAAYAAAKAGLEQLVAAACLEFGPLGVRVNAVAPGLIKTPRVVRNMRPESLKEAQALYPLGEVGTPSQIASVILFLAGNLSAHVNGQTVYADGGISKLSPFSVGLTKRS
jgi:NAD(P)-dependent dehydrogenase (short-subunit alcohol dehydrogenase family)